MDYGYVRNEVASYIYDLDGEIIAMYLQNDEDLDIEQLDKFIHVFFQHLSAFVDFTSDKISKDLDIKTIPITQKGREDLIILLKKSNIGDVDLTFDIEGRVLDTDNFYEYPVNYYLKKHNNNGKELNLHINKIAEGYLNEIVNKLEEIVYQLVAV